MPQLQEVVEQPKPAPVPKAEPADEIKYPEREVIPCWGDRALNYDKVKAILDLESEPEFTARMVAENPKIKEEAAKFNEKVLAKHKLEVLCEDEDGNKLVAWNNQHNRPFDKEWCFRFRQEFLHGQFLCNGEAFIIGDRGNVLSGIKRAVGFCLAVQAWRKDPKAYPRLTKEPVWETVVSRGFPETPELIRTLDNVKPRTDSDTIFSVGEFDTPPQGCKNPTAYKKECSRMLGKATDFLWDRTGFGRKDGDGRKVYKTPSEDASFRDRHKRIYQAVKHVYEENADRAISGLKLSPGMCAAILYLQGCGASDGDAYLAKSPPKEAGLDWSLWDKAKEFWSDLAKAGDGDKLKPSKLHDAVRQAFIGLSDPDDPSTSGRLSERLIVLAKAWDLYRQGKKVALDDLTVDWVTANGETKLDQDQLSRFGAIDLGPAKQQAIDEDVPEETAEQRREAIAAESIRAVKAAATPAEERAQREALDKANEAKAAEERKAKLLANRKAREEAGKENGAKAKGGKIKLRGGTSK